MSGTANRGVQACGKEVFTTKCAMSLRSSAEHEIGGAVGCGESANRIERMRATTMRFPLVTASYTLAAYFEEGTKDTKVFVGCASRTALRLKASWRRAGQSRNISRKACPEHRRRGAKAHR